MRSETEASFYFYFGIVLMNILYCIYILIYCITWGMNTRDENILRHKRIQQLRNANIV